MTIRKLALIGAALIVVGASAPAQQTADMPLQQTEIESVRLRAQNDGDNAYIIFSEAVVLRGTNLLIECDQLEIFATRAAEGQEDFGKYGAIKEVIATGHVRITQAQRVATCEKAIVKPREERIILAGNPAVEQPGGLITVPNPEDEIVLERGNGTITVNTKGPKKLRLVGSPIRDLGFEQKEPEPTQPLEDESTDAEPSPENAAPAAEDEPAHSGEPTTNEK